MNNKKMEGNNMNEQYYIIRGDRSGVFFGQIEERNGQEVKIRNCRRLWYWDGAASISQLALDGTKAPNNCKFTVTVDELTILDAIELIPCTEVSVKSIQAVKVWMR